MKAVKITTDNEVYEIDTATDKDFNTIEHDGGALIASDSWRYKKI